MNETTLGLIRHVLTAAGGALVTDGLATGAQVQDAAGAITILIAVVWSIWNKVNHKKALAAASAANNGARKP